MAGLNKVQLIGNLGADPEIRYTAGGSAIANLRIATSESWTDQQSGEKQERTEWHRVVCFGKLAEIVGEHTRKGRQVYVEGKLRTNKYTDKEGIERFSTDVVADEVQFLGPRQETSNEQHADGNGQGHGRNDRGNASSHRGTSNGASRTPSQGRNAPPSNTSRRSAPPPQNNRGGSHDGGNFDDDIPY